MNIYQSNPYSKDLRWPHLDKETRVQERWQVKDQQSYKPSFVADLTFPRSSLEYQPGHDNSIPCKVVWYINRDTQHHQEKETTQNESRLQFS